MCGIAGIVGGRPDPEALRAMAAAMRHRGPDDERFYTAEGVGLAFRRLAIVDLESGHQPLESEDGSVVSIFNGEIYNHRELRKELEGLGHRFRTDHADGEVLVHGWEAWGTGLFERLNGMFAAAIWDGRERELVLARDRFGIKPLYTCEPAGGGLAFASEIRPLLRAGLVSGAASTEGIAEYFSFQNVIGEQTMFEGVKQFPPGHWMRWRDGRAARGRYWRFEFPRSRRGGLAELAAEHRAVLQGAVRRQLAADVPVKTYLSGGIDSTAVSVIARAVDPSMTAYSCIFELDGVGDDRHVDEREYSRLVATACGMERVELEVRADALAGRLERYVASIEDLRMGMGYPIDLIAERVAADAKVVLSGTGGDEVHFGYIGRYQAVGLEPAAAAGMNAATAPGGRGLRAMLRSMFRGARGGAAAVIEEAPSGGPDPARVEALYRQVLTSPFAALQGLGLFEPGFAARCAGYDAQQVISDLLAGCSSEDWRDRVMEVDARTYLVGLLVLEDKLSMSHSLETRVPLLDNELVDFMLDVPHGVCMAGGVGKVIFRESVRPLVPAEIYAKPKMGFGPPEASWYRGALRPFVEETLSERRVRERGVYDAGVVRRVLDEHMSGARNHAYPIWSMLNFETWCGAFGVRP